MLVITATSRPSLRKERSDSSASITPHSPAPQAALVSAERSSPPIRKAGSRPAPRRTWATIEAVVVLPCAPLTAIVRFMRDSSPSRSARCRIAAPAARAAASSGLSSGIAVETTTSAPTDRLAASWPTAASIPAVRRRSITGESTLSEPDTRAPSKWATSARPLIPAPPIPTKCRLRPANGASPISGSSRQGEQLAGDPLGSVGPGHRTRRLDHRPQPLRGAELGIGNDHGGAGALDEARVLRLVVGRRVRVRDQDRRQPRGGHLHDRAA